MYKAFGIVSSSGRNIYVDGMQDYRPIGAFSFLGRYRVIDFPISNMSNTTNIESLTFIIDDICQSIHGRKFLCFFYKADEQLSFHDTGIHVNVLVFLITMVCFNCLNTFLAVQIQYITG